MGVAWLGCVCDRLSWDLAARLGPVRYQPVLAYSEDRPGRRYEGVSETAGCDGGPKAAVLERTDRDASNTKGYCWALCRWLCCLAFVSRIWHSKSISNPLPRSTTHMMVHNGHQSRTIPLLLHFCAHTKHLRCPVFRSFPWRRQASSNGIGSRQRQAG